MIRHNVVQYTYSHRPSIGAGCLRPCFLSIKTILTGRVAAEANLGLVFENAEGVGTVAHWY